MRQAKEAAPFGGKLPPVEAPPKLPRGWSAGWSKALRYARPLVRYLGPWPLAFELAYEAGRLINPDINSKWGYRLPPGAYWCQGPVGDCGSRTWLGAPYFSNVGSCAIVPCLSGQADVFAPVEPWTTTSYLIRRYDLGWTTRASIWGTLVVPLGTGELPQVVPATSAVPASVPLPVIDPLAWPVIRPMPMPAPVPYELIPARRVNPERAPSERTDFGPPPAPRVRVAPRVDARTRVIIRQRPGERPVSRVDSPHTAPPGPRTKEKKGGLPPGMSAIWNAIGFGTEGLDFISAVYDAGSAASKIEYREKHGIPRGKGRPLTPDEKARYLWEHWDDIDVRKAIQNVLREQLSDAVTGGLAQGVTKTAKPLYDQLGRPVGFTTGPGL